MKTWCEDKPVRETRRCGMRYVDDEERWPSDAAYTYRGVCGVAWRVYGWEVEGDEDTESSGIENRTGRVIAVMVGDDRPEAFDPEDLEPLEREAYCGVCGQVGCAHDGLELE